MTSNNVTVSFKVHKHVGTVSTSFYVILMTLSWAIFKLQREARVSKACHLRYVTALVRYAQRLHELRCHSWCFTWFQFYRPHWRTLSKCKYTVCSLIQLNSPECAHNLCNYGKAMLFSEINLKLMGIPLSNKTKKNYFIFDNRGCRALKKQLHFRGTLMILPCIVASGFVAFFARHTVRNVFLRPSIRKISPKVTSECPIQACTLGKAIILLVYTRELLSELGAQSQMIRIVQLLIISICVKLSSSYKVGQVIEENNKTQGIPRRCFVAHL